MKNIFIILLAFISPALAAQNAALQNFSAQQKDDGIITSWVIGKGFFCSDIEVQHSTDSVNFTTVYTYPGICGSSDEAKSYTWLHTGPAAGKKNYYRLNLSSNGYSEVVSVIYHSFDGIGYVAAPNPSSGPITIFFRNSENIPHTLVLFDLSGKEVKRISNITSGKVIIDPSLLRSGTYIFRLFDESSRLITGRIVIL